MNDYKFGNYLYALRKKAGLTQTTVAFQVGVTNKAVSKWENGKSKPNNETLNKLANLYGVSADSLLAKMSNK